MTPDDIPDDTHGDIRDGSPGDTPVTPESPRFLHLADVARILNITASQTYALVRSGELRAIKVGARGQWRVEAVKLEEYIEARYDETADFVRQHPLGGAELLEPPPD